MNAAADAPARARVTVQRLRAESVSDSPACDVSEESEESLPNGGLTVAVVDQFVRWRLADAERRAKADHAAYLDPLGYCAEHHRVLSYPEQKRGA
jgi:hypothetical protein